jgi:hypothetical protein
LYPTKKKRKQRETTLISMGKTYGMKISIDKTVPMRISWALNTNIRRNYDKTMLKQMGKGK